MRRPKPAAVTCSIVGMWLAFYIHVVADVKRLNVAP